MNRLKEQTNEERSYDHGNMINVHDNIEIFDTSSGFNVSTEIKDTSFDNSFQMNKFLQLIKEGKRNKNKDFSNMKDQEFDQLIQEGVDLDEALLDDIIGKSNGNVSNKYEKYSRTDIKEDDQQYSHQSTHEYLDNSRQRVSEEGESYSKPRIPLSNDDNSVHENKDKDISNNEGEIEEEDISQKNVIEEFEKHQINNDTEHQIDYDESCESQSPTLEMIQEETEVNEKTKIKESDFASIDKIKYVSKTKQKKENVDQRNIQKDFTAEHMQLNSEIKEKRKEEIQNKIMNSTYSSMSSFKQNMFESLDMNKGNEAY